MAEQFIVKDATSKMVRNFVQAVKCTITDLFHTTIPWNAASTAQYNGMFAANNGGGIVNRAGLPPHFYIEIPAKTFVPSSSETDLVRNLVRSTVPTILKNLDSESHPLWNQGRKFEALNNELEKGPVSISIFYLDKAEATQALRDKVNSFPKKI